jgi:serine/threonine protein kinase/tetratricopeptide (TPR) repeat protein
MNNIPLDEEAVFQVARRIADPEARAAYLGQVCGGAEALRDRVEQLLRVCEQEASFLAAPVCVAPVDGPSSLEGPGTVIGPYKLLEPIGEGGMGTVFMAEQTKPVRRKVAFKIIKPGMDTKQVIARFEAERQALALMDHPNIARVLDAGATESGRPYFVMELVRGIPITEYCDREHLGIPERLELFAQVCRAVQHAHQKGIIHRDLKPTNILITMIDGIAVPKIIDFGVAKATGQQLTEKTLFTAFAQMVGTPLYMSPEQADLAGVDIDTRSDIYSLGVLLYELLTGTTPFDRETFRTAAFDEIRRMIREEEPPKPSTRLSALGETITTVSTNRQAEPRRLSRAVFGELDWIVMKALEKDRRRRYETAGAFAADVQRHLAHEPVEAGPPSAWYRFTKYARRNRVALVTAALVGGSLIVGTAVSTRQAVRARSAERLANRHLAEVQRANTATTRALAEANHQRALADRQRAFARKAVDEMYTQVAQKWLSLGGGLTPIQREFLEKALAFYEEFAREQADDPEAQAEVARAASRVGEIRSKLGQSAGALESHRRALETFRSLAAKFPDRPEYQRGVAQGLHDIGDVQKGLARTHEAEESLRQAVALRQRRAEAAGLSDDRADLAVSLRSLADLLGETGRYAEGERLALRGIELLGRLSEEFPKEPRFRRLLASAEMGLGDLLSTAYVHDSDSYGGRSNEADARFRRALELFEKLAESEPAESEHQLDLAKCHTSFAHHYRMTGRSQEALAQFRRALPLEEALVRDHSERPGYRSLLVGTLSFTADVLSRLKEFDEAERTVRRSLEVAEKLAADFPDFPEYREDVEHGFFNLARILAQRDRHREAREAYERTYGILSKLVADYPDRPHHQRNLGILLNDWVNELAQLSGPDQGDPTHVVEIARKAVENTPKLAGSWSLLAVAEYRAGNFDAALRAETKRLELLKNSYPTTDQRLLALIYLGRGDRDQARHWAIGVLRGGGVGGLPPESQMRAKEEPLKELLPTDAEGVRAALAHALEVQRRTKGDVDGYTFLLREYLADQLATLGRYTEATALWEEALQVNPDQVTTRQWFSLGVCALRRGDLEGYRALCAELLRRSAPDNTTAKKGSSSVKPPTRSEEVEIARLCSAAPRAVEDPKGPLELGRRFALDDSQAETVLARGAVEYRAGEFPAAVETLTQALVRFKEQYRNPPWPQWPFAAPPLQAQAHLFLSMAHHRLGHAEEARRNLAEADRILAEVPNEPEPRTLQRSWRWRERIPAEVLRREAGLLLGTPQSTDLKK